LKARFIQEIGTRASLRVYWGEGCKKYGCHNAMVPLLDLEIFADQDLGVKPEDYPNERWPTHCSECGEPVPAEANRQVFRSRLYNTSSGQPEPGDIFYDPRMHAEDVKPYLCKWDNCNDPRGHLKAILPNGQEWDIDGRASNCTMPEDREHRCWVRHGEPSNVHVDKNGHTCQAGAGSILSGDYHGFLHNGEFTPS